MCSPPWSISLFLRPAVLYYPGRYCNPYWGLHVHSTLHARVQCAANNLGTWEQRHRDLAPVAVHGWTMPRVVIIGTLDPTLQLRSAAVARVRPPGARVWAGGQVPIAPRPRPVQAAQVQERYNRTVPTLRARGVPRLLRHPCTPNVGAPISINRKSAQVGIP